LSDRKELELEEIRSLALEALRNFISEKTCGDFVGLQHTYLIYEIECIAAQKGLIPTPSGGRSNDARVNENEFAKILEVVSDLMTERIIMWGMNRSNLAPPFMSITSYGKKMLAGEDVVPHDPEGYIKMFKNKVPNSDPLILTYLTESVQTFRTGNLLASSTMLGVASEAAFDILFDAITKALTGPKKQSFEKLAESIRTKTKFDEMMKVIEQNKNKFPQEIEENISSELDGIFNLIRYQRNDTGHPTGKIITRDQMFVSLRLFIMYCSKVYAIVNWLNGKQI